MPLVCLLVQAGEGKPVLFGGAPEPPTNKQEPHSIPSSLPCPALRYVYVRLSLTALRGSTKSARNVPIERVGRDKKQGQQGGEGEGRGALPNGRGERAREREIKRV